MAFFAVDKADTASFTVKFGPLDIRLQTEAKDSHTDSSQGTTYADSKFTDTVSYQKLTPGREYTVKGTLMDKDTGKAITVNGKAVTSEKKFTAEKSAGTVTLEYDLDASTLKGKTTVVFEELYYGDLKIASHECLQRRDSQLIYGQPERGVQEQHTFKCCCIHSDPQPPIRYPYSKRRRQGSHRKTCRMRKDA
jgi:hypothetical protein